MLAELRRRHRARVIELSLSSVGEEPAKAGDGSGPASTVTNRIQKEIVKQILYRDPPWRTSGSRFRRLAPPRFWRELPMALGVALLALGVLFLTTWSRPLVAVADGKPVPLTIAYVLLWLLLAAAWLLVRYATYGRLSLEKLTAGPATSETEDGGSKGRAGQPSTGSDEVKSNATDAGLRDKGRERRFAGEREPIMGIKNAGTRGDEMREAAGDRTTGGSAGTADPGDIGEQAG